MDANNAAGEVTKDQPALDMKGMTFDKLKDKFSKKLSQEKTKAFEQKFSAEFKKLDDANAIVRGIERTLEKLFVEFTENV